MFELTTVNQIALFLPMIGVVIFVIGAGAFGVMFDKKQHFIAVLSALFGLLGIGLTIFSFTLSNHKEYSNNPVALVGNYELVSKDRLRTDYIALQEKLEEEIGADKVTIDKGDDDTIGHSSAKNVDLYKGNMIDFSFVKDGKLADGKFYYTEDSLEILVGEGVEAENISVPTE